MGNTLNYTIWTNGAAVDVYHLYSLCTSLTLPYVGPFGKLSLQYHAESTALIFRKINRRLVLFAAGGDI